MIWEFDLIILIFLVVIAVMALRFKNLISATLMLGAYSFLMCLLWAEMGAVDVAFTEAAVGAGLSTVFMLATILKTTRRSRD